MSEISTIHGRRQGRRPHYLRAWMDVRHLRPRDIVELTGADKGLVSRWLDEEKPTTPGPSYCQKLREALMIEDPDGIFRHPNEDWMARWLRRHSPEEIERAKALLDAAFPDQKRA